MKTGSSIAHYRIMSRLGAGGMGEVWLAKDTRLGRNVAVKFLHQRLASNPDWLRRFLREARAVASLNHPNIAQIHELFMEEGIHMIVMEYVDGRTLTQRIREKRMTLNEVVDAGIQVADALEEAHSKGIVHRDVKPGNIMINARGLVKVLDFGIAKLPSDENTTNTHASVAEFDEQTTRPGEIRGTPRYMSREQCLGMEIDHRSDLFSLGSVLYEMATGANAFPGQSPAEVYQAILNRVPPEPSSINNDLPSSFDRIVARAMEKDRDRRYASAVELRADLKELSQAMHPTQARSAVPLNKTAWLAAGALTVVLVSVLAWHNFGRQPAAPQTGMEAIPLTATPGTETQPSFSPDGLQVAFASNGEGANNWDIYSKLIRGGPAIRLTTNPEIDYSPAWSPDGGRIAFLRKSEKGASGFYVIPSFGGSEHLLSPASNNRDGVDSPYLAWAPDGKALVISDKNPLSETASLYVLDVATGTRRKLTDPPSKSFGDSSPVLVPDGKTVLFVRSLGMGIQDIFSIPFAGGQPVQLTFDNRRIYGLAWNQADNKILFASGRVGNARLWRLPLSGGKPEHILGVGEAASFIALSPKGDRLAFTRSATDTNIWQYDLKLEREPKRLIASTRHEQGPQYSPDGKRIVFASTRTGAWEIYVANADGTGVIQLTTLNDKPAGSPQWSPDGKSIVFDARPDGNPDIYMMGLDGGAMKRIVEDPAQDVAPTFSRDGKSVYFASNRSGRFEVWKTPLAGGAAVQVTKGGGFYALESVDLKDVFYAKSLSGPGLWKVPIQGGAEAPVIEELRGGYWGYWVPTKDGIYYLDQQTKEDAVFYSIKFYTFAKGEIRMVRAMPERPFNSGLTLAPDGRTILYTQADRTDTDIMLVENFR